MTVDNVDISGYLHNQTREAWESKITSEDLLAGHYDFAEAHVFLVNYLDLAAGILIQKRGIIREVTLKKNMFYAEVRGLTQYLSQSLCEKYLPHCRANLGDERCRFNFKTPGFTAHSSVLKLIDQQTFVAKDLPQASSWFTSGNLTWLDGRNEGLRMEAKEFADSTITLVLPMSFVIYDGDRFMITAGCDKSSSTCIGKFDNIINFRGEPDLPGSDKILSTATSRK